MLEACHIVRGEWLRFRPTLAGPNSQSSNAIMHWPEATKLQQHNLRPCWLAFLRPRLAVKYDHPKLYVYYNTYMHQLYVPIILKMKACNSITDFTSYNYPPVLAPWTKKRRWAPANAITKSSPVLQCSTFTSCLRHENNQLLRGPSIMRNMGPLGSHGLLLWMIHTPVRCSIF